MRLPHRPHVDESRQFYARLIVLAVLVGYAVAFILENGSSVSVHFVFATEHVSLIWVILLALAVGLLGGILLAQLERRRRRRSHEPAEPADPV